MAGRILYNNLLRGAGIVTDVTPSGFGPDKSTDGRTTTFSKFNSGINQGITYDLGAQVSFDSLAVARHNFSSSTYLTITGSNDGINYTNIVYSHNVIYDKNLFINLGSQSYRYVQFVLTDLSSVMTWADVFIGPSLALERSQKHGFTRPGLADGDTIVSNVTRGKELAGLTVVNGLDRIVFNLPYYSSSWLSEFPALRDTLKQYPIYIIWDISRNETPFTGGEPAFYCWPTDGLPRPRYSKSIQGYYDLSLDMSGFYR
ncbi:MAG: discoidin domain-containing protein [Pontibacterium sp.]